MGIKPLKGTPALNNEMTIADLLRERITVVRRTALRVVFIKNSFLSFACILLSVFLILVLEALFDFSRTARTWIFFMGLTGMFGGICWWILRPLFRYAGMLPSESDETIARTIGNFFPAIKDRLLNALQLASAQTKAEPLYSPELTTASLTAFIHELQPVDLTASVDRSAIPRNRNLLFASLLLLSLSFGMFPHTLGGAAFRLAHFSTDFLPPPKYNFEILPGNMDIVKNDRVDISVRVTPLSPSLPLPGRTVSLFRKPLGQEAAEEIELKADSTGKYHTTFSAVETTTEYFAFYNGEESSHYMLSVLDRPIIRSFHIHLEYPAYTKLPGKLQDDFIGDITALAGTRVTLSGFASKPLRHAELTARDSTHRPCSVSGDRFSASFVLTRNTTYCISLSDAEGLTNADPVWYEIKIITDEHPSIAIIEPGRNIDVAGTQSLPLHITAKDDYSISSIRLGYRLLQSKYEHPQQDYTYLPIPCPASSTAVDLFYSWDLSSLHLVPEDVVEYFAEVFDNNTINGPQSGRSSTYLLRLPSLEEVFSEADKEHEQTIDDIQSSLKETKKLKEELESLNRDLKKNKDPNWQTKKKLEEMAKKYEAIQKKMDETKAQLEQMTQQLQQQHVLSQETLEKYMELQQMMQQINSEELQKMLRQAQQTPNLTKEQLQRAMKQMSFSEEQFRQSIERTLELLKRMHIEQKMDEVKKRAQELEHEQQQIQQESAAAAQDAQKRQELANRQNELARNEQALEREAADLQKRMEEFFTEMPAGKMQQLSQQLQQQQLNSKMQQAAQQLQSGNMQQSQQMMQDAQQQLQQFSQQMDAMQRQMLQRQAQYVRNELRKATNNLLELSKDEEALKQQSQQAPSNSSQLKENAQQQQKAMRDLQNVISALSDLSQKSFAVTPQMGKAIGQALLHMNNAQQHLIERNGSQASQEQAQAMAGLNDAAMQVQSTLNALQQGGGQGGAGSLMQQLQQLAGQQMAINMQTQQMGGMSQQQMEQAARLAQQQGAVQKSLEQLNKEAQQSGDKQRILGDLQRIAEEMKEVVHDLEQHSVNNETKRKQDRILSRLLNATTSMREQDYEKKRKSETGKNYTRTSPQELDPAIREGKNRLHDDLLKALEQGYTKDYQELIKKYFEQLENSQKVLN